MAQQGRFVMKTSIFTFTSKGLPVIAYEFQNGGPEVLILGGVHGDEIEGVIAAQELLKHLMKSAAFKLNITLVPQFNLEGVIYKTRGNGNGVDLNRNLPTQDWSPEVKTPPLSSRPPCWKRSRKQRPDILPRGQKTRLCSVAPLVASRLKCQRRLSQAS